MFGWTYSFLVRGILNGGKKVDVILQLKTFEEVGNLWVSGRMQEESTAL
jgi:hypothetical protein